MVRLASIVAMAALLFSVDSSGVLRATTPNQASHFSSDEIQPAMQDSPQNSDPAPPKRKLNIPTDDTDTDQPVKVQNGPLQPMSRLSLVRYVDGELVNVVRAIPSGKKGFHLKAGAPLDEKALRMAVASAGASVNPGDHAQITDLNFKENEIVVDINGGGKGKTRLRDRIHMEVGGVPSMTTYPDTPVVTNVGATLYLDFDKPLPDMTAEDLERYFSGVLDFSKRHSAAVQWVESLPPEIQKAIEDKQPVVGMDHDMVLAAMGRPDRKVREKGPDGDEIEDWIYGTPPAKTIFVSFEGDKVMKVEQFPK